MSHVSATMQMVAEQQFAKQGDSCACTDGHIKGNSANSI